MHLSIVGGYPAASLNHHEYNITSTAQRSVGAAWRYGEFGNLRGVVREDCATENTC
jgi:hypothetical protein